MVVSIAQSTALGAYRKAERATQLGMRNVRFRSLVSTGTEVSAIVGFQNSLAGGFGADR